MRHPSLPLGAIGAMLLREAVALSDHQRPASPNYRPVPRGRHHATTREAAEATATELLRLGPVSRQVSRQAKRLALKAQRHR